MHESSSQTDGFSATERIEQRLKQGRTLHDEMKALHRIYEREKGWGKEEKA